MWAQDTKLTPAVDTLVNLYTSSGGMSGPDIKEFAQFVTKDSQVPPKLYGIPPRLNLLYAFVAGVAFCSVFHAIYF